MSEEHKAPSNVEKELIENGAYMLRTAGRSMKPLFKNARDIVVISKKEGRLKKYDVALYRWHDGKYVLHRVIGVRNGGYIMRGDNTFIKENVKEEDVVGVLTSYIRNGKKHTTEEFGYRLYSRFWHFIYPIRAFFRKIRIALSRIYRKIFKKGKNNGL